MANIGTTVVPMVKKFADGNLCQPKVVILTHCDGRGMPTISFGGKDTLRTMVYKTNVTDQLI